MARKKITINRWDGGMSTNRQANTPEEMASGFALVSNFDIYTNSKLLKPVPEFLRFNTQEEEQINFKGLGASGNRVYATGLPANNWYASAWSKRVKITPDGTDTPYLLYNLENMPAGFWSSTGTNKIVVTTQDGVTRTQHDLIGDPDTTNETGWVAFRKVANSSFYYIYYDVATGYGSALSDEKDNSSVNSYGVSDWYNFVEDDGHVKPRDYTEDSSSATYLLDDGSYNIEYYKGTNFISDGLAYLSGTVTQIENVEYYNTAKNRPSASSVTVAFTIYSLSSLTGDVTFYSGDVSSLQVLYNNSTGKINAVFDSTGEVASTIASTTTISALTPYRVMVTFTAGTGCYLYINGVLEASDTSTTGNLETTSYYAIRPRRKFCMDAVFLDSTAFTATQALQDYNQIFDNANFWATGNEETYTTRTLASQGIALYSKTLTDSVWTEVAPTSEAVRSSSYNPIVAPILASSGDVGGTIAFFGDEPSNNSVNRIHLSDPGETEVVNFGFDALALPAYDNTIISAVRAIDNIWYLGDGATELDKLNGATFTDNAFTAYPTIASVESWNGYVALGGKRTRDYKSWVQIWDRSSTASTQSVDFGVGDLRVLGNVNGTLFGVINNYIDDSTHASIPSMDIKYYEGGNIAKTLYSLPASTTMDNYYSESWEQPVSQLKGSLSDSVVFYAKVPSEDTYWEGFWAIGQNKQSGNYAVSLLHDTSSIGDVINMTTIHNQIVCIHDTNKVSVTSPNPSYTANSKIYTKKYNAGNSEDSKKLVEVQISTEPLTVNQTVTLYYRIQGETAWTEIGTVTGLNTTEASFLRATSDNFRIWKEIEFRLDSINGSSAIKELAITYEESLT